MRLLVRMKQVGHNLYSTYVTSFGPMDISVSNQVMVSENERVELRKTAIHEIKNFLPGNNI